MPLSSLARVQTCPEGTVADPISGPWEAVGDVLHRQTTAVTLDQFVARASVMLFVCPAKGDAWTLSGGGVVGIYPSAGAAMRAGDLHAERLLDGQSDRFLTELGLDPGTWTFCSQDRFVYFVHKSEMLLKIERHASNQWVVERAGVRIGVRATAKHAEEMAIGSLVDVQDGRRRF